MVLGTTEICENTCNFLLCMNCIQLLPFSPSSITPEVKTKAAIYQCKKIENWLNGLTNLQKRRTCQGLSRAALTVLFEHGGFSPDCLLTFFLSLLIILLPHKWHPLNTTNELLQ